MAENLSEEQVAELKQVFNLQELPNYKRKCKWIRVAETILAYLQFAEIGFISRSDHKGCFTKNQDFHFLDSVKFVLVIGRIKGFDHDLFFLWASTRKNLIQKFV